ncbi:MULTISPECIES: hypothetical protein [unclassified Rhizobium]|uniref:hypothetical protein n=1 Tax=unclassified Rhizobium TaxID=2613769 RepID=UPI0016211658|nr:MULTISPECIES: hypothetical protein [unclassified Rhizobium]MBB3544621.1 hypothetical protein [Rhizobium sp. BK399]MCS3744180.1 hypothetical protein [Rhizobium sp. BK661]MCS4096416.1 hypothetical protein [Rhizobium sp. BK176]
MPKTCRSLIGLAAGFTSESAEKTPAYEVGKQKSLPSRKGPLNAELVAIKSKQASLVQLIQDRHADGRLRLCHPG